MSPRHSARQNHGFKRIQQNSRNDGDAGYEADNMHVLNAEREDCGLASELGA